KWSESGCDALKDAPSGRPTQAMKVQSPSTARRPSSSFKVPKRMCIWMLHEYYPQRLSGVRSCWRSTTRGTPRELIAAVLEHAGARVIAVASAGHGRLT